MRRRRRSAAGAARLGLTLLLAASIVVLATHHHHGRSRVRAAGLVPAPAAPSSPGPDRTSRPLRSRPWGIPFARARGVTLLLPAPHPVGVLYHEASFHDALALHPLGHAIRNANTWKFHAPPDTPGPGYTVMSSR